MKFLIDNALSPIVATGLAERGIDAIHVRDIGMSSATDSEIFDYAVKDDRIIVSADTDFATLLSFHQKSKPSFILFKQTQTGPASQLNFLVNHISSLQEDLLAGCIVVFEDTRIRIRPLPIERKTE